MGKEVCSRCNVTLCAWVFFVHLAQLSQQSIQNIFQLELMSRQCDTPTHATSSTLLEVLTSNFVANLPQCPHNKKFSTGKCIWWMLKHPLHSGCNKFRILHRKQ